MKDIQSAFGLAMQAFHDEFGKDARIEEGDEIVFKFNNCVLIISLNNGELGVKYIGGRPIVIDYSVPIFGE